MEYLNLSIWSPIALQTPSNISTSPLTDLLDTCLLTLSFLCLFPIHSYVLWLIVSGGGITSELFNLNVCVCEILYSLESLLTAMEKTIQAQLLSQLAQICQGLALTSHPLFLSLICVERFLAVVHPVTFLKLKPLRYRIFCCSVAWTISFGSFLFCSFTLIAHRYDYMWFFSLQFLIFFSIQLLCCVSVLRALKQSGPGERKEENHRKRRAFLIILITTISMGIMNVPYILAGLITAVTRHYVPALWSTGLIFFILAGFVQPVIYLQRTGKLSLWFSRVSAGNG